MTSPDEQRLLELARMGSGPQCKRCKGKGILVVDNGFHYTDCPDCNPSYADYRGKSLAASLRAIVGEKGGGGDA